MHWLGRVAYRQGLALQDSLVRRRRAGGIADTLLLLEHDPVVTLGRGASTEHVTASAAELEARGIELVECGRGGDVTYHGPGQLVGYPIVALSDAERDAHRYLRALEQGLIDAVAGFGVTAVRVAGLTGVWVGDRKLAAIGVRLSSGWIASHGFALNVDDRLDGFDTIVPCGIRDRGVTSLAACCPAVPALTRVAARVAPALARALGRRPVDGDRDALGDL